MGYVRSGERGKYKLHKLPDSSPKIVQTLVENVDKMGEKVTLFRVTVEQPYGEAVCKGKYKKRGI